MLPDRLDSFDRLVTFMMVKCVPFAFEEASTAAIKHICYGITEQFSQDRSLVNRGADDH